MTADSMIQAARRLADTLNDGRTSTLTDIEAVLVEDGKHVVVYATLSDNGTEAVTYRLPCPVSKADFDAQGAEHLILAALRELARE